MLIKNKKHGHLKYILKTKVFYFITFRYFTKIKYISYIVQILKSFKNIYTRIKLYLLSVIKFIC